MIFCHNKSVYNVHHSVYTIYKAVGNTQSRTKKNPTSTHWQGIQS